MNRCGVLIVAVVAMFPLAAAAKTCDVRASGAKGDGSTKDTASIQRAIDACAGGGTVHFAAGTYLSAPLEWKSGVRLQLDEGAVLLGSPDMDDYPVRADAPWRKVSLLHADHATNIALTGAGIVDGNGAVWWRAMEANRAKGMHGDKRPMLIDLTNSKKILIEGVTIRNSPQYNVLAVLCDGLTVRGVKILNPGKGAPNTDGVDPVSTSHVLIEHSTIDTGDDNVAIKSGLVERGDPNIPSTDIVIRDCDFRQGHGLSIGSETAGGVRNVSVERVTFDGTRQGVRIKSARGRGNDIGNFTFRDLTMTGVETPIQITMYYTGGMKDAVAVPVTEHTPRFHDITIENLNATGAKFAALVAGLPESPVKGLVLKHVHIEAQKGADMRYANVTAEDFVVKAAEGDAIVKGPGLVMETRP